jgi:adenosylhomocysteine nucleosidase
LQNNPEIALVMATFLEAKPFIENLDLKQEQKHPFPLFANAVLRLVISGVGKANAAMATALYCHQFKPACLGNFGAAGALSPKNPLGEIFQVVEIREFDRPHFKTGDPHLFRPHLLEGFQNATLATSDRVVVHGDERHRISQIADLVDMEGAAVVQAARRFKTPCHTFKFVSDDPGDETGEGIENNIRKYRTKFFEYCHDQVLTAMTLKYKGCNHSRG